MRLFWVIGFTLVFAGCGSGPLAKLLGTEDETTPKECSQTLPEDIAEEISHDEDWTYIEFRAKTNDECFKMFTSEVINFKVIVDVTANTKVTRKGHLGMHHYNLRGYQVGNLVNEYPERRKNAGKSESFSYEQNYPDAYSDDFETMMPLVAPDEIVILITTIYSENYPDLPPKKITFSVVERIW